MSQTATTKVKNQPEDTTAARFPVQMSGDAFHQLHEQVVASILRSAGNAVDDIYLVTLSLDVSVYQRCRAKDDAPETAVPA